MAPHRNGRPMLATILLTALLTLAVVIVVANVTGPEKKV